MYTSKGKWVSAPKLNTHVSTHIDFLTKEADEKK